MTRRLIELLLLLFITFTGCSNSDLLTGNESFVPTDEFKTAKEAVYKNEALTGKILTENAYIVDSGMGLPVHSGDYADDETIKEELSYTERSMAVEEVVKNDDEADNENGAYKQESITLVSQRNQSAVLDGGHGYYKNVPADGVIIADAIAQQIATSIVTNPAYTTDLERVSEAARVVKGYCDNDQYGQDTTKYYRSPYGVFVAGIYTCAGSTRALGRVLDFMGYSWQHIHENENRHQWCVLTIDGQTGFADGMSGIAGYGKLVNGMTLPDGSQIFFAE